MSSDQILTRPDTAVSSTTDGGKKILSEQSNSDFSVINARSGITADSAAMVASSTLPPLQIDGASTDTGAPAPQENDIQQFFHDAATVVSDIGTGAWNEVTQHPLEVLEAGATGLIAGVGITAAAVLIAPEVAVAAAAVGLAYGAVQVAEHIPGWLSDVGVVSNTDNFSAAQVAQAHSDLQGIGRGGTLVVAGALGGLPSGAVYSAAESAVSDMVASSLVPQLEAPTIVGDLVQSATTNGAPVLATSDAPLTPVQTSDAPLPSTQTTNSPLTSTQTSDAALPSTQTSDATQPAAQTSDVAKNTSSDEPVTAEPMTVEQSVETNQNLFRASQNEIVPSVKQSYQVRFEKAGPGGRLVPTLENPAGVQAPEGQWIATRLNADGTPNVENGVVNSWTIKEPAILKTYKLTPEQLAENNDIVGWTNTEAPPVHMVQLKAPMDIETKWGPMHGDAGSWLANYDYDPAIGAPGSSYAIVTAKSYADTYKPV